MPCIWGITPGITTWPETRQSLDRYGLIFFNEQDALKTTGTFRASYPRLNPTDDSNYIVFNVKDNLITGIRLDPETAVHLYQLPQLLTNYGAPSQVFLRVEYSWDEDSVGLVLLYEAQSFLTRYRLLIKSEEDQKQGCSSQVALPDLTTWSLGSIRLAEDVLSETSWMINSSELVPIQEATEFSVTEFYEQYRNSEFEYCIPLRDDFGER